MSSRPCFMFDRVPLLLKSIVFVCFSLTLGAAQAQNISNGRNLYLNGPASLPGFSCAQSQCHGPSPANIVRGIQAAANDWTVIRDKIASPGGSGMGAFSGRLTETELRDIAAFIANPNSTAPDAPTIATVTAGNRSATVTFSAPGSNGGSAITGYTVTSTPAGGVDSNASSTSLAHTITGLVNGTAYTFVVTATNAIGTSVASAASNSVTPKANQTITFGTAPTVIVGRAGTFSATGGASGNAVTFSSAPVTVCTISGTRVTGISQGSCTITANQAGTTSFNAAAPATQVITVGSALSTVVRIQTNLGTIDVQLLDAAAPATVANFINYVTSGAYVNSFIHRSVPGFIIQGGGFRWSSNSTTNPVSTIPADPPVVNEFSATRSNLRGTIAMAKLGTDPNSATNQWFFNLANNAFNLDNQNGGFTVFGQVINGGMDVVDAIARLSLVNAGSPFDNLPFIPPLGQSIVTANLVIVSAATVLTNQVNQSIQFTSVPTIVAGGTGTISATGGASGNPVIFSSTTPSVCTVSGTTVTGVTFGICTIAANQAAGGNFNAAPQLTQNINVGQGAQSINFGAAPTVGVGGTGTLTATGGASGNPVTFSSTTSGVCSVSGTTVSGVSAGTCTVAGNQSGNANYTAAVQATQSFTIGQGSQTINFGAAPTVGIGGTGTVSATGGASGNPVTFSSTTAGICSVSGTTVTGIATGTCIVAANQVGNTNYAAAAQATQSFTVGLGSQTIIFGAAPMVTIGGTGTVSATGGGSGNAVTFTSTTPAVCTINGTTVTGVLLGTCTIAANQGGNTNFSAAPQVLQNISISKATQSIGLINLLPATLGVTTTTVGSASATSGLTVSFSSLTLGVCSVTGTTITGIATGACIIAADQAGNDNYLAAPQVTRTARVGATISNINFTSNGGNFINDTIVGNGTSPLGITTTTDLAQPFLNAGDSTVTLGYGSYYVVSFRNSVGHTGPGTVSFLLNGTTPFSQSVTFPDPTAASGVFASFTLPDGDLVTISATGLAADRIRVVGDGAGLTADGTLDAYYQLTFSKPLTLVPGFNLLGNSQTTSIDVVATFGNVTTPSAIRDQTLTVWKWVLENGIGRWAFHSPSFTKEQNATYAAASGFAVLTSIEPKAGFWVNAASPFTLPPQSAPATTFSYADFAPNTPNPDWPSGFNLVAIGTTMTPTQFNNNVAQSSPLASGAQMTPNFVSLWSWDANQTRWYFYAPSLEIEGGLPRVKNYTDAQGFLDFASAGRMLEPGTGFWINK